LVKPQHRFLFNGNCCEPLSPFQKKAGKETTKSDLLYRIMSVIGPQSEDDLQFISLPASH